MADAKAFDQDAAEDAAMLVFWERGYADASVDLLGAAMGLGRSSIYNAFGGEHTVRSMPRPLRVEERALASHSDDVPPRSPRSST